MSARTPAILAAAGVVLAVGEFTDVQSLGSTPSAQLAHLMTAPAREQVASFAFIAGAFLLVVAMASAWNDVVGRGALLTRVGLAGLGGGAVWYAAVRAGGDLLAAVAAQLPHDTALAVYQADEGWSQHVADLGLLMWLVGPILLWVGLRRARGAHWVLLVVYLVATVVEVAFSFQSLVVEGVAVLGAVGSVAAMIRVRTTAPAVSPIPERSAMV